MVKRAEVMTQKLICSEYCNLVVEKLRDFTKAPGWLQDMAAALLTTILVNVDRNGLLAVLHGYLDGKISKVHLSIICN